MRRLLLWLLVGVSWVMQGAETHGAEFPFQFHEGLIWVEVRIPEASRPLCFLLDSGAEASVINLQTAKALGLSLGSRVGVRGVHTSTDGYWCSTRSASANGVALSSRFLALDLTRLSASCGRRVDGLIGLDFFQNKVVQIDFRQEKVRVISTGSLKPGGETLELRVRPGGMCLLAGIDAQAPDWFRVDTGCASALQWVTSRVKPTGSGSKVAVGLAELQIPQARTTVALGNLTLKDVETGLHRTTIFAGEAGLVGNGLLSRFETVTIDTAAGRLLFGASRSNSAEADESHAKGAEDAKGISK